MPDRVLLEEFHLTFTLAARTPDSIREAARRALNSRPFRAALRRAVRRALGRMPAAARVRLAIST